MGVDCPPGCFPAEVIVKYQKKYTGSRTKLGSVVIQLTKDVDDAIVCMLFKTEPWQIGKSIINSINKAAKGKGKEPEMKVRHKGIDWVGVDKSALTSHCPYVEKMGWFATADSCKGAKELVQLIKSLSSEILTANLAADFYLGELVVPPPKLKGLNVILNILQRKMIIDADDNSGNDSADNNGAAAASAASESQSGIFD